MWLNKHNYEVASNLSFSQSCFLRFSRPCSLHLYNDKCQSANSCIVFCVTCDMIEADNFWQCRIYIVTLSYFQFCDTWPMQFVNCAERLCGYHICDLPQASFEAWDSFALLPLVSFGVGTPNWNSAAVSKPVGSARLCVVLHPVNLQRQQRNI
jgi:hypothetical protein